MNSAQREVINPSFVTSSPPGSRSHSIEIGFVLQFLVLELELQGKIQMASRLGVSIGAALGSSHWDDGRRRRDFSYSVNFTAPTNGRNRRGSGGGVRTLRVSNEGAESYLDMWKNAVDREKKEKAFEKIAENVVAVDGEKEEGGDLEKKSDEFQKILEVSVEERDRIQRMQVVDRAAAAISAAKAILASNNSGDGKDGFLDDENTDTSELTETSKNAKSGT